MKFRYLWVNIRLTTCCRRAFSVANASCLPDNNTVDRRKKRISLSVKPGTAITCMLSIEDAATRTTEEDSGLHGGTRLADHEQTVPTVIAGLRG